MKALDSSTEWYMDGEPIILRTSDALNRDVYVCR